MPFVNVTLDLDIDTYEKVKAGTYELLGMVKNHNHRVKKHLPTVVDSAKEGAAKAIDIVRNHKKELLIVGGIVIVGSKYVELQHCSFRTVLELFFVYSGTFFSAKLAFRCFFQYTIHKTAKERNTWENSLLSIQKRTGQIKSCPLAP